ncbi:cbb3-type cytochrome oxidase subunit 3 [Parendozoicomonas haliclonae]|uniref:Cbb3-type cytochrome oxidase component FixQ n=1 Tax=Parendozoicomonas haliclonae TaxID=1960125 RepID=A0A1X7AIL8_9GAMM|nr:cbb3-type cytochrome c oxidase subunit 3 [Parendozoicomonas haliclonae]SMA43549.1 Cbb3-type cytochrome oxidase component FixQ [Parendozoicomonas haliclonae]
MDFDINTLRGLATVLCMAAFIGVVLWAYSERKSKDFDEAASLPFADEDKLSQSGASINNKKEAQHV